MDIPRDRYLEYALAFKPAELHVRDLFEEWLPEESLEGLHPAFRFKVTYASLCDLVLAISRLFSWDHSKKRGPLRGLHNIGEMVGKVKRPRDALKEIAPDTCRGDQY